MCVMVGVKVPIRYNLFQCHKKNILFSILLFQKTFLIYLALNTISKLTIHHWISKIKSNFQHKISC